MKASEVRKKEEQHLQMAGSKRKLKVGDYVRISKVGDAFDKKYLPNWSTEIFLVKKVQFTNPTTYFLKDAKNVNVLREFYEKLLQKVKYPDAYLE